MKRVRTKSSDIAGNMEPPKKSRDGSVGKRSPSPKAKSPSPNRNGLNGIKEEPSKFQLRIKSHGRVNGPVAEPEEGEEMLKFSVREIANPPAKLRKKFTGLSPRLRKEIFSDKLARLKYDTMVIEMEKMMTSMETALAYDVAHPEDVDPDDPTPTILIICIQCEEGRHRSVSYAEELAQSTKRKEWSVSVEHRDLGVAEVDGIEDDDDDDPPSPAMERPKESTKTKKKKDKSLKKARDRRLHIEVADSGAEDGFH